MKFVFAAVALLSVVSAAQAQSVTERVADVLAGAEPKGFSGEVADGDRDGVILELVRGQADRARGLPHRAGQIWRYASVTKQITATLVMMQVDRGLLSLDDPVSKHLPDFAGPSAARVTIRNLLQHPSGLPNSDDTRANSAGVASFYTRPGRGAGADGAALSYCAGAPKAEPGARFAYNNCDSIVVGEILRRATGRSYERLVRENISTPLKMRSLRYAAQSRAGIVGYDGAGNTEPGLNIATFGAGGALFGTARDLLTFDRALAAGDLL
jgi:CubicO group peptidase (beta-lactamase class C family)